jgi:sugar/nucleoside kinase (ribokinase family)
MTRGAEGAVLATANGTAKQQGIPTNVKDTVGAGDAFAAALLLGVLRGESHDDLLRAACEIAADVCAHAGAVPKNCTGTRTRRLDNGQVIPSYKTSCVSNNTEKRTETQENN